ncbi:MAG: hypothetical protein EOO77_38440, partial [Oxalobacteraceae bacterium]
LDKRAALTVWLGHGPAHVAQGHEFPTLRQALAAAAEVIDAEDVQPWIITEDGDILPLMAYSPARPRRPI